jgi:FtsZ-interacting cell division protein YlmF
MSATIHYLRPFEREDLAEAEPQTERQDPAIKESASEPEKKRTRRRLMPCGRNSRFKKRMDGTVVPRERR